LKGTLASIQDQKVRLRQAAKIGKRGIEDREAALCSGLTMIRLALVKEVDDALRVCCGPKNEPLVIH
jgi:hypothetical protein